MIAADIILSRVMIKPDYAVENNDADQPTHLHSLTNAFVLAASIVQGAGIAQSVEALYFTTGLHTFS